MPVRSPLAPDAGRRSARVCPADLQSRRAISLRTVSASTSSVPRTSPATPSGVSAGPPRGRLKEFGWAVDGEDVLPGIASPFKQVWSMSGSERLGGSPIRQPQCGTRLVATLRTGASWKSSAGQRTARSCICCCRRMPLSRAVALVLPIAARGPSIYRTGRLSPFADGVTPRALALAPCCPGVLPAGGSQPAALRVTDRRAGD
jgi:hypothetical protein